MRLGNRELLEMEKIAKTAGIAKECRLEMQNLELQKSKTLTTDHTDGKDYHGFAGHSFS